MARLSDRVVTGAPNGILSNDEPIQWYAADGITLIDGIKVDAAGDVYLAPAGGPTKVGGDLDVAGDTTIKKLVATVGGEVFAVSSDGGGMYFGGATAGADVRILSAGNTAITLDSGQNATFAGDLDVSGDLLSSAASAGANAFSAGNLAGTTNQGTSAVAVGNGAGQTNQGAYSVATGHLAGNDTQGFTSVAVGTSAGTTTQGTQAVAVGRLAGATTQGASATAVGNQAGQTTQGDSAVAVGTSAGQTNQGIQAVAVGRNAAGTSQGDYAVAIGNFAGNNTQGSLAVAIGFAAGQTNQGDNGLLINTTGSSLDDTSVGHIRLKTTQAELSFTTAAGWNMSGNVTVAGALSKGSGSFRIDHPLKPETHELVHSFTESPQADLLYSGSSDLVDGAAEINLDEFHGMTEGTFVALNRNIRVFTTNETDWEPIRGSVTGNILTISCRDDACTDKVSWLVIGERQDDHMMDTDWTDEQGRVIVEPLKPEVLEENV